MYQYENELLFMVGDWYHWPSAKVLATFMSATSTGNEVCLSIRIWPGASADRTWKRQPGPDSLLINGLGYFECSMATAGAPVDCSEVERPWLVLDKNQSYRVRLINVG